MGLKYLLLLRFGLVNLVAFALLGAAWAQGLVAKVINADVTNMVILICVVFLIGLILAGYRLWKVSKQLNAAYNFNPDERSRASDFIKKTKGKNATSRANIAQALRLKLFSRIVHIRYISNSLTVLGLIGTVLATFLFSQKHKINTYIFLDLIALVAPIGIFFGRIANFINSELYGKETDVLWSVKFLAIDNTSRHPSQIYEAIFEGLI